MRICVFSDSHGCEENMTNAIRKEASDFVIFLGDGEADFRRVKKQFPAIPGISVAGNTDANGTKRMEMRVLEGKRILCVHGDRYNIKKRF